MTSAMAAPRKRERRRVQSRRSLPSWLATDQRRPRLLAELKQHQARRSRPVRAKALPYWLRTALVEEFGSVNAARKLAGLDAIRGDGVAPSQVLPQITELHAKGVSLAFTQAPRALVTAAVAQYGSWQSAIEAAGIDYAQVGLKVRRFSDDDLLDWLRSLAKERPVMTLGELSRERRFAAAVARFGSWQRATKRAGLSDWPQRQKQRWTKPAIIAAMRTLAGEGKSMSTNPNLCNVAKRHFGSLQAAAAAAGVRTRAPRTRSKKEVIATLREIAREHGTVTNALAQTAGIRSAVVAHFGTLTTACEAAGVVGYQQLLTNRHEEQSDPRILLDQLRTVAARLKQPVTRRDLSWTFYQALLRHFESLDVARERAGLSQPVPATRWSRKLVLDELRREHRKRTRMTRNGLIAAGRGDLLSAIGVYVGTFGRARRIARIPAPAPLASSHVPFLKIWDEDRVIEEIEQRVTDGEALAPSLIPRALIAAACRYWGNWRTAVEVAGHDYAKLVLRRDRSDDELLDLIRTIAEIRPQMTSDQLRSLPFATTLYRRFGTLETAAERAGLTSWPTRKTFPVLSRAQLRMLLRERIRAGRPVAARDFDRHVRFSMSRIHPVWSVALSRLRIKN